MLIATEGSLQAMSPRWAFQINDEQNPKALYSLRNDINSFNLTYALLNWVQYYTIKRKMDNCLS